MGRRLVLYVVPAVALAALDLAVKALVATDPALWHQRSAAWAALASATLALSFVLALLPSSLVAFAAGVVAGGVLGNLVSGGLHDGRVANPLVIAGDRGGIAFNVADVVVLVGIVLLTTALVEVTIRHRHLLPQHSVVWRLRNRRR